MFIFKLSETEQEFIGNIIIARNVKSLRQINLQQTQAANDIVFSDNEFMDFVEVASEYMLNMNMNKLNDISLCSESLAQLNKSIEKIINKIRKKAYSFGWDIVCGSSN